MPNLSSLVSATTTATALSNLILVTPQSTQGYQPQVRESSTNNQTNLQQPPSILFNYEGEQTVTIESDITDHYVENNTAIQDQIALRPEIITTHGFIGELNDIAPVLLQPLQAIANRLTVIDAYTPVLSQTAIIAYNEAFQAYQLGSNIVNAAVSAWSTINNVTGGGLNVISSDGLGTAFNPLTGIVNGNQSKQQVAFQQFYGYWRSRILFTVQTPWAVFKNMAIRSLRAIQDEKTNVITDFEVQFKMIRFASTTTVTTQTNSRQGRNFNQAQPVINLGTSTPASSTSLSGALGQ